MFLFIKAFLLFFPPSFFFLPSISSLGSTSYFILILIIFTKNVNKYLMLRPLFNMFVVKLLIIYLCTTVYVSSSFVYVTLYFSLPFF